jgi:hypothetical protein
MAKKNEKQFKLYKTDKAQEGDIIVSSNFAYCVAAHKIEWDEKEQKNVPFVDIKNITVDEYKHREHKIGFLSYYTRKGKSISDTVDVAAFDRSRGLAKFVVEKTAMEGGGTGHGPNDIYPDGWHVFARRLSVENTYDPKGELINFYQSGCFNSLVKDVEVVGKMNKKYE